MEKIKVEFAKWSLLTKFDCFSKIFTEKNSPLKLFWLVCFLLFSGGTTLLVLTNIFEYYMYEVVSKIEIINEKPIEFPAVTICNANPFTTPYAQDLLSNITTGNYNQSIEAFGFGNLKMDREVNVMI